MFSFGIPWNRIGETWLTSKTASILFGISSSVITGVTFYLIFGPEIRDVGLLNNILAGVMGVIGGLGTFFLWSGMLRYWERCDPSGRIAKRLWFIILLLGIWYGAILYYLLVYLPNVRENLSRPLGKAAK